ncbi:hypothetical protein ACH4UT_05295 [Streptomyces sp. NPDC020799]|uniref:hypothetical protein n=1 Tax=unclassified Streptomyces TaxID=2593676 RepID=UPI0033CF036D
MTACPWESNCECHWGSREELALLKIPDVVLDPDLLHRTWSVPDWQDHAAVMRRVLPQLTEALARGEALHTEQVGLSLKRAGWHDWPEEQSAAVSEFLRAWWDHVLGTASQPAPDVFEICVTASGTVTPWLAAWESRRSPVADRHLLDAVEGWVYELEGDRLPFHWWYFYDNEAAVVGELNAWLASHAPARVVAQGAPLALVERVRRLGMPFQLRWDSRAAALTSSPPSPAPPRGTP